MVTFWAWAIFATAQVAPNVLFFFVDDFGYMDVGANHPGTFYETPHIDSLAAEGMRFTHGYAANPVCSPTRYSIMTGKYPTRAGATQFFLVNVLADMPQSLSRKQGMRLFLLICHFTR